MIKLPEHKVRAWLREKDLSMLLAITTDTTLEQFERKRMKHCMLVLILLLGWPLYAFHYSYGMIIIAATILVYKLPYFRLRKKQKRMLEQLRYEFPLWLRQLQVLLQNNTVLTALQRSVHEAPTILQVSIHKLIVQIEEAPLSIQPYLEFMQEFEIYEIQKAMKLLYRYHFVGAEESYRQFHRMIEATAKWLRQGRKDNRTQRIFVLEWLGMLPLFGVTFMFLVMMIVVILDMMKGGLS